MEICGLHDIGFQGLPWTYDNKQSRQRNVKVRLDRAVATDLWHDLFEDATVEHLLSPCSDHCPILLRMERDERMQGQKILRYEIMCEREETLGEELVTAWKKAGQKSDLGSISKSLREVMQALHNWSKETFGSIRKELEELRKKLGELQLINNEESNAKSSTRLIG